ncbi:MAG: tetratricopeptide repeat protein [Acidobacteriaceae bacterium]
MTDLPTQFGKKAQFASYLFNMETGELSRFGVRLRLESQPAKVLALLIEAQGKLLPRSELIAALWPGEVTGDFDRRLDKAVAKLRASLNDDPVNPLYIETLKGRGYCFVHEATVKAMTAAGRHEVELLPEQVIGKDQPVQIPGGMNGISTANTLPRSSRLSMLWGGGISGVLLLAATAFMFSGSRFAHHKAPGVPVVLILPFRDARGHSVSDEDEWVSHAVTEWLSSDLNSGGELLLIQVDKNAISQVPMAERGCRRLSQNVLEGLHQAFHADLVVYGDYTAVESDGSEDGLQLNACLDRVRSPMPAEPITVVGEKRELSTLVLNLGDMLRMKLGLKRLSSQSMGYLRAALPPDRATAQLYVEGTSALANFQLQEAAALLTKAEDLEPQYAPTHAALSTAWFTLGHQSASLKEAQRARELARNLSPEQQLEYQGLVEEAKNNWSAAVDIYSQLARIHPDSISYALKLASAQTSAAHPLLALETLRILRNGNKAAQADPKVDLAEAASYSGSSNFKDQLAASIRAESEATNQGNALIVANAQMEQGNANEMLGHWTEASKLWQLAQQSYEAIDDQAGITDALNSQAALAWSRADRVTATRLFDQSLKLSESVGDSFRMAYALSRLGAIRKSTERAPDGSMPEAMAMLRRSAAIYHSIGNGAEEGYVLSLMADVDIQRTHYEQGHALYLKAMSLSEAANDKSRVAGRLLDLGIVAAWEGDNQKAIQYFQQSNEAFEDLGQQDRAAIARVRLGEVLFRSGKVDEAESMLKGSLATLRSFGRSNEIREALGNLTTVELAINPAEAEVLSKENISLNKELGWNDSMPQCYALLAEALIAEDKVKEANEAIHQAFLPAKSISMEFLPFMLLYRGDVRVGNHDYAAAAADFERSLQLERQRHLPYFELESRLRLAELHIRQRGASSMPELDRVKHDADKIGYSIFDIKIKAFLQSVSLSTNRGRSYLPPQKRTVSKGIAVAAAA